MLSQLSLSIHKTTTTIILMTNNYKVLNYKALIIIIVRNVMWIYCICSVLHTWLGSERDALKGSVLLGINRLISGFNSLFKKIMFIQSLLQRLCSIHLISCLILSHHFLYWFCLTDHGTNMKIKKDSPYMRMVPTRAFVFLLY